MDRRQGSRGSGSQTPWLQTENSLRPRLQCRCVPVCSAVASPFAVPFSPNELLVFRRSVTVGDILHVSSVILSLYSDVAKLP